MAFQFPTDSASMRDMIDVVRVADQAAAASNRRAASTGTASTSSAPIRVVPLASQGLSLPEWKPPAALAAAAHYDKRSGSNYKKGGMTASARADGIAQRGKTKGRYL